MTFFPILGFFSQTLTPMPKFWESLTQSFGCRIYSSTMYSKMGFQFGLEQTVFRIKVGKIKFFPKIGAPPRARKKLAQGGEFFCPPTSRCPLPRIKKINTVGPLMKKGQCVEGFHSNWRQNFVLLNWPNWTPCGTGGFWGGPWGEVWRPNMF